MAKSYYKTINGKNYDRDMLNVAEKATPRKKGKPLIEIDLAKKLFKALADGNEYTDVEKKTMKYIRDNYQFTKEADSYVRTEVRKFAANQAIKSKEAAKKSKAAKTASQKKASTNKIKTTPPQEVEIQESSTIEDEDEIDLSNSESYSSNTENYDSYNETRYNDDDSGFREFVAYKDQDKNQSKERRKKYMIRAGLVVIFFLLIFGIIWTVCKPKSSDPVDKVGFETLDPSDNPAMEKPSEETDKIIPDKTDEEDITKIEKSERKPEPDSKPLPTSTTKEEGPSDEEFKFEPGIAAPVKRIAFDLENQKSSIRFVNSLEVPFVRNQKDITPEGKKALDDLAEVLKKYPNMLVRIEGHTCWIGSQEDNQKLSESRSKIIYDYLLAQGVSSNSLEYRGYGELSSIATNRTKEGRLRNRRVEFSVLKLK
ncbi:MAG: OmpA family protein [Leptospira sp.]|nr:OmpA family protein [Leptospira sp.]